ncbi:hypothetical protein L228DRAFT_238696 [Xylona heveae TC161]|uniref:Uncharacterized protein n=1 Tax=Xylona heveae (strain CBS 132557 / TC161) TaxID=1328760 RepID=A0A165GZA4_XYLHT|nr:hypothetical protein L228DRAFT_238696 [Xylona heveae TC161]KZF22788.1 hypothetical protein L228DRAFT_238696 [Xylona heveae TC161]
MPATTSEADIVFNRANVALAKSQRLIASWLPPKTSDESANAKTEEDLDREEQEIFTPVPDQLGLGAPLPKDVPDGAVKRRDLSSNEALRKRLLGKNANKIQSKSLPAVHGSSTPLPGKNTLAGNKKGDLSRSGPVHARYSAATSDDEDDEGGRSSLGKSKKRATKSEETIPNLGSKSLPEAEDDESNEEGRASSKTQPSSVAQSTTSSVKRARAANFLDEMLAEKAQRKKKKKNKNKQKEATGNNE